MSHQRQQNKSTCIVYNINNNNKTIFVNNITSQFVGIVGGICGGVFIRYSNILHSFRFVKVCLVLKMHRMKNVRVVPYVLICCLCLFNCHSQYLDSFFARVYSYWLVSSTTPVLFDPRTDLLPEAAGWLQQTRSRVKQNCCCPRSQSITVLLYTFIFQNVKVRQFPEYGSLLDILTSISRDLLNQ